MLMDNDVDLQCPGLLMQTLKRFRVGLGFRGGLGSDQLGSSRNCIGQLGVSIGDLML